MTDFVAVAVNNPKDVLFHYSVPLELKGKIGLYHRVIVPLRNTKETGFVLSFLKESEVKNIKPVAGLVEPYPLITPELFKLAEWIAKDYACSLNLVLHAMLTNKMKLSPPKRARPVPPDPAGNHVLEKGVYNPEAVESSRASRFEYYAGRIKSAGGVSIVIIPDISRMNETAELLENAAKVRVLKFYTGLGAGIYQAFAEVLDSKPKIILASRQGVFLPAKGLKLVIIDEENDFSFKSDETPGYDTSRVALKRGELEGLEVVLGSYALSLRARAGLAPVKLKSFDLSNFFTISHFDRKNIFSPVTEGMLRENINAKKKTIVMAMRKGYSSCVRCFECGFIYRCNKCGGPLTQHLDNSKLRCKYCGKEHSIENTCPKCKGAMISGIGIGVEKVESELKKLFPVAKIGRADSLLLASRKAKAGAVDLFKKGAYDILAGTHMAVNYLRFAKGGTAVVLDLESIQNYPDFSSAEDAFQFLSKLADNAGGAVKVVLQLKKKENPLVAHFIAGRAEEFFKEELLARKELSYPPYSAMALITIYGKDSIKLEKDACVLKQIIESEKDADVLGPLKNTYAVKGKQSYNLMVKARDAGSIVKKAIGEFEEKTKVSMRDIEVKIRY